MSDPDFPNRVGFANASMLGWRATYEDRIHEPAFCPGVKGRHHVHLCIDSLGKKKHYYMQLVGKNGWVDQRSVNIHAWLRMKRPIDIVTKRAIEWLGSVDNAIDWTVDK